MHPDGPQDLAKHFMAVINGVQRPHTKRVILRPSSRRYYQAIIHAVFAVLLHHLGRVQQALFMARREQRLSEERDRQQMFPDTKPSLIRLESAHVDRSTGLARIWDSAISVWRHVNFEVEQLPVLQRCMHEKAQLLCKVRRIKCRARIDKALRVMVDTATAGATATSVAAEQGGKGEEMAAAAAATATAPRLLRRESTNYEHLIQIRQVMSASEEKTTEQIVIDAVQDFMIDQKSSRALKASSLQLQQGLQQQQQRACWRLVGWRVLLHCFKTAPNHSIKIQVLHGLSLALPALPSLDNEAAASVRSSSKSALVTLVTINDTDDPGDEEKNNMARSEQQQQQQQEQREGDDVLNVHYDEKSQSNIATSSSPHPFLSPPQSNASGGNVSSPGGSASSPPSSSSSSSSAAAAAIAEGGAGMGASNNVALGENMMLPLSNAMPQNTVLDGLHSVSLKLKDKVMKEFFELLEETVRQAANNDPNYLQQRKRQRQRLRRQTTKTSNGEKDTSISSSESSNERKEESRYFTAENKNDVSSSSSLFMEKGGEGKEGPPVLSQDSNDDVKHTTPPPAPRSPATFPTEKATTSDTELFHTKNIVWSMYMYAMALCAQTASVEHIEYIFNAMRFRLDHAIAGTGSAEPSRKEGAGGGEGGGISYSLLEVLRPLASLPKYSKKKPEDEQQPLVPDAMTSPPLLAPGLSTSISSLSPLSSTKQSPLYQLRIVCPQIVRMASWLLLQMLTAISAAAEEGELEQKEAGGAEERSSVTDAEERTPFTDALSLISTWRQEDALTTSKAPTSTLGQLLASIYADVSLVQLSNFTFSSEDYWRQLQRTMTMSKLLNAWYIKGGGSYPWNMQYLKPRAEKIGPAETEVFVASRLALLLACSAAPGVRSALSTGKWLELFWHVAFRASGGRSSSTESGGAADDEKGYAAAGRVAVKLLRVTLPRTRPGDFLFSSSSATSSETEIISPRAKGSMRWSDAQEKDNGSSLVAALITMIAKSSSTPLLDDNPLVPTSSCFPRGGEGGGKGLPPPLMMMTMMASTTIMPTSPSSPLLPSSSPSSSSASTSSKKYLEDLVLLCRAMLESKHWNPIMSAHMLSNLRALSEAGSAFKQWGEGEEVVVEGEEEKEEIVEAEDHRKEHKGGEVNMKFTEVGGGGGEKGGKRRLEAEREQDGIG
eukprot:jgi/Bigna1/130338/aug1.11_g5046